MTSRADIKTIKEDLSQMSNEIGSVKEGVLKIEDKTLVIETTVIKLQGLTKRRKEKYAMNSSTSTSISSPDPILYTDMVQPANGSGGLRFVELLTSTINMNEDVDFQIPQFNETCVPPPPPINPITPFTPKVNVDKKRKVKNKCATFIKNEMYSKEELLHGSIGGGNRKYKDSLQEKDALSPGRMKTIISAARKRHRDDFEDIKNINEVVNSKCRQVRVSERKKNNLLYIAFFFLCLFPNTLQKQKAFQQSFVHNDIFPHNEHLIFHKLQTALIFNLFSKPWYRGGF